MDKNLYLTGGQPLRNDDLRHAEQGLTEALLNLVNGLGRELTDKDSFRLFGAGLTIAVEPGDTDVDAGAIVINGEIYTVDAKTIATVDAEVLYFVPEETFTSINPRTFFDASSKNVNAIRKATIVYAAVAPAGSKVAFDLETIEKAVRNLYKKEAQAFAKNDWVASTLINNFGNLGSGNTDAQFRVTDDKTVQLRGQVKKTAVENAQLDVIFVLPVGARPAKRHKIVAHAFSQGLTVFGLIFIIIESNGNVLAQNITDLMLSDISQANDYLSLDGITFHSEL